MAVESTRRPRTRVTLLQFVTSLLVFVVLSVMGGFLVAGLALPAATLASNGAQGASDLFEELPKSLAETDLPQQSNIYDRSGTHLLATFYLQNRVVVPLEEISPWLQKAVVAVEDKRFFDHHGVDGQGLVRAAYVNLTSPDSPGGSTLTQQLVKNILLQNAINEEDTEKQKAATEVSVTRKIREMRLALALEERVDETHGTTCTDAPEVDCGKEQVLEQYLNIAQFGLGVYGAETAAQVYFGKPASQLNAIEAATIAGITQNPSKWDPLRYPENTQVRRNVVLTRMYDQGMITEAEYKIYRSTTVATTLDPHRPKVSCSASTVAPFFCDYVTKIIKLDPIFNQEGKPTGTDLLYRGGLNIITTLDYDKQVIANEELRNSMSPTDKNGWAMALVALDPANGEILTMAQNKDFDPSAKDPGSTAINYSVDRKYGGSRGFSPGSTFKPIVLATWLEQGHGLMQSVTATQRKFDPASWVASCLGEEPFKGQKAWAPANSEGGGSSSMTVLKGTQFSVNTAYASIGNQLDLCDIKDMAAKLGFERADGAAYEPVPASVLGVNNASPLSMASVAQTFANKGEHCQPVAILSITKADGEAVEVPPHSCEQVISEDIAVGVTYGMQQVIEDGTGTVAQLAGGRPAAGKTGTAQLNTHLWFMGFTPQLVATVWMGNPDQDVPGRNLTFNGKYYRYLFGGSISAPTWKHFMDRALEGQEELAFAEPTEEIMYGVPREVPSIVGKTPEEASRIAAEAGFGFKASDAKIYTTAVPEGTCANQSIEAGSKVRPSSPLSCNLATTQLPDWWYNWPAGWDPNVPPSDYWGDVWPPAEFATNPPAGWDPTPATEQPDNPGGGGGGGNKPGWPGNN